jgi:hypothetical protein
VFGDPSLLADEEVRDERVGSRDCLENMAICCRSPVRFSRGLATTGIGASRPLPRVPAKVPLTEPTAGAQPRPQERVLMPLYGGCTLSPDTNLPFLTEGPSAPPLGEPSSRGYKELRRS